MTSLERNHVTIAGDGPTTLVFGHGFGTDQTAWDAQVEAFRDRYRILRFDMVGAGRSDLASFRPKRYTSLYTYANDLLEIARDAALDRAIYIGHSVSGMIGLLASQLNPGLFSRMILIGASPRYLNDGDYRGGFEQSDLDSIYESMSENYYGWVAGFSALAMGNPDRPELAHAFASTLESIRPDIAQAVVRVIFQSDHRAELPKTTVPCAILQSAHDVAVPLSAAEYLRDHIPGAALSIVASDGHFPHISEPAETARAIRAALAA